MESAPPSAPPRPGGAANITTKGGAEPHHADPVIITVNPSEQPLVAAAVVVHHPLHPPVIVTAGPSSGCCTRYGARAAVGLGAAYAGCSLLTLSQAIEAITTPSKCGDICDNEDPSKCSYHCFSNGWCKHGDVTTTNGWYSNIACPDDTNNPNTIMALGGISSLCALFCVVLIAIFPLCCSCDCFGGCHRYSKFTATPAAMPPARAPQLQCVACVCH